jgi:2-polyprenyl-3-methyl-5-hydroxy-6-metoxy-1,4-benzoquinol methylase
MPRNTGEVQHLHHLPRDVRAAQGDSGQLHWYRHITDYSPPEWTSVLDVGAAAGSGLAIMSSHFRDASGIDLLPTSDHIESRRVESWPADSADLVTAVDVIEHVEDDVAFLCELRRIARCAVFISTPNWAVSKCQNSHHIREYTADELSSLVGEPLAVWVSDGDRRIAQRPAIMSDEASANFGVLLRP